MKVGDVVQLPSGSGKMTVMKVHPTEVEVCWMGYNDHQIYVYTFPSKMFEQKASPPPWDKNK